MMVRDNEPDTPAQEDAPPAPPAPPAATPVAPEVELAEVRDKYLRLAAEFDNFRKRAARDRTETWGRAQADLVQRLVDGLDDLARFAHFDASDIDARTLHDGVQMVERKLWKELDGLGVRRIDQVGVPFDPNVHEAVTTAPATTAAEDHTIGVMLQPGYQFGNVLIRPARVVVRVWQDDQRPANGQ